MSEPREVQPDRAVDARVRRWQGASGSAGARLRPDGRWMLVLRADPASWPELLTHRPPDLGPLLLTLPEDVAEPQRAALLGAGFVGARTEQVWRVPLTRLPQPAIVSGAHRLVPVSECDLAGVVALDDAVRRQIPGCEQWSGTVEDLRESLDDDAFDPELYLVAQHRATGSYDGVVRVWSNRPHPRLGCIGVTPPWGRTRLAAALLWGAVTVLRQRGVDEIEAETDVDNRASFLMARNHGGIEHGRTVEWILA